AFTGQAFMHSPQLMQTSEFILASVPSNVIASTGQTFAHFLNPIQPTLQFFLTTAPLSKLLHATVYSLHFGTISIIPLGHAATHFSQALHLDSMTVARPSIITIASKGHALTQFPRPTQP